MNGKYHGRGITEMLKDIQLVVNGRISAEIYDNAHKRLGGNRKKTNCPHCHQKMPPPRFECGAHVGKSYYRAAHPCEKKVNKRGQKCAFHKRRCQSKKT